MSEARGPDPTRRSERSRTAILSAAIELVTESGYAKTSIEAIAARAGVGKQTIYRWWPSKAAVVFDAVLDLTKGQQGFSVLETGDLKEDLKQVLRATAEELTNPRMDVSFRALALEIQYDANLASHWREKMLGPALDATKDRLRSAQHSGEIDADLDLDVAVELLYGPLYHRWLLQTAPVSVEHADAVVDLAMRAMSR
ncbi:TetR/AcrR family transcriptional regulator [Amycolatopsis magusensis]|uniref:AcrR family transcriptional regulator n=1 Tax=Amycolatopsis magusensis TaxID=882444 RepID=A0ABS4Q581_9PSEU|nr:TetR/AcrR family transcriptional regulator [Amycolatopsis magusensis]MBP2186844.1 AcrR family transcriptional regulator [Amycolatopsis magusensis]MDI5978305.1 TetR/AcrR family transcriptional regulator [Amycolatopsis magusensis]UJW35610.1 TetR/AcrR family transcriptional regulator [Saccharothrix sp. AJ9571]